MTRLYNLCSGSPVGAVTGTVSQLSRPSVQAGVDDAGDDTDQGIGSDSATPMVNTTWRHYPFTPREVMIIGSFGDQIDHLKQQSVNSFINYVILLLKQQVHCITKNTYNRVIR